MFWSLPIFLNPITGLLNSSSQNLGSHVCMACKSCSNYWGARGLASITDAASTHQFGCMRKGINCLTDHEDEEPCEAHSNQVIAFIFMDLYYITGFAANPSATSPRSCFPDGTHGWPPGSGGEVPVWFWVSQAVIMGGGPSGPFSLLCRVSTNRALGPAAPGVAAQSRFSCVWVTPRWPMVQLAQAAFLFMVLLHPEAASWDQGFFSTSSGWGTGKGQMRPLPPAVNFKVLQLLSKRQPLALAAQPHLRFTADASIPTSSGCAACLRFHKTSSKPSIRLGAAVCSHLARLVALPRKPESPYLVGIPRPGAVASPLHWATSPGDRGSTTFPF